MKPKMKIFCLAIALIFGNVMISSASAPIKGRVTCDGKGLAGVVVSDGKTCVPTDKKGNFAFEASDDAKFVFVSTPSGYLPQVKEGSLPVHFKKFHGEGCYDFELVKNDVDDSKHVFFVQADVQLIEKDNLKGYKTLLEDINKTKESYPDADFFGLDCGDIVGDTPALFPPYIKTASILDMPVYRVIGNHDMNYYGRSFETSMKTFEGHFGPVNYSFNRGKVHYIVLDNCFYIGRDYFYMGYVDENTFEWLEQDLAFVPKGSTVVMAMHIPTQLTEQKVPFQYGYSPIADQTVNAGALHAMLEPYNAHIISGHMHYNLNICFSDKLMEHNTAAVCGTWWCSDVCLDGTPVGYGVYVADGDDFSWYYKSSGYPESYQMRVYLPGASEQEPNCVIANVWNYDPMWKVEWLENGKVMGQMQKYTGFDPYAGMMCKDKTKIKYDWIGPTPTEHLFKAVPVDPQALIEVRVTDRFGKVYTVPAEKFEYK